MAQVGGMGVLHKNMNIEKEAAEVTTNWPKWHDHQPHHHARGCNRAGCLKIMKEYGIGGIPVVDQRVRLVGIVINRDLRFERRVKPHLCDVMTRETRVCPP